MTNFLKLKKFSLLFNYYVYMDTMPYTIDEIADGKMYLSFGDEFAHPEYPGYCLSMAKCFKWDSEVFEQIIMPELHNRLISAKGDEYVKFLHKVSDDIQRGYNQIKNKGKEEYLL